MVRRVRKRILTHANNVALNGITKGQVAGDGDQDVNRGSRADAGADDADKTSWRVVLDLVDDGEHLEYVSRSLPQPSASTHILMASIRKDHHRQTAQGSHRSLPRYKPDGTPSTFVVHSKVVNHQDDQIPNRKQRHQARILERIQLLGEAQRDKEDDKEDRDPEPAVRQKVPASIPGPKRCGHGGHQITDNDHV